VHLHFTSSYTSWLNQVALWFGCIERELLTRGIFTSVKDLARQIGRYIRHYNNVAKPIRWKYADPTRRITGSYFGPYRPFGLQRVVQVRICVTSTAAATTRSAPAR
jgi:hypothetical protein